MSQSNPNPLDLALEYRIVGVVVELARRVDRGVTGDGLRRGQVPSAS